MGQTIRNELISVLVQNQPHYLSGEEISRKVGCSRAAIWKHIEELRQQGYEIEAQPRNGYRLVYRPDRVAPEELSPHLQTKSFGRHLRYEYSTPSTQILAHQWAREGAPEGAVVIAEEQVEGRGRMGRLWHSPPQTGIWMSLILRPPISLPEASQLTLLASVGVHRGIERVTGLPVQIKWPNDLMIQGKKVCGILTELRGEQDRIHYIIVGIGINVNTTGDHWPTELRSIATSLAIELGGTIHRATLIAAILEELEDFYQNYLQYGFPAIQKKWEQAAGMLGKTITAHTHQVAITGVAECLNEHGALLIRTERGMVPVYSADIDWH
ncbi:biotin--[acetyl-CoA-carboxylase] ligase [Paenactinomyces guangxiensis]|uniref:Bifunctional ligase/repressor BirA n=1 Tax=Paenactinomyces guangxiensis TaxID=1490290 RepID=A0A7W1WRB7_9BACL|nr:biotin--[acetyl-CoA-carboxylase] ligase [Paenactinomyces guangxiensis]MBA4494489.1 biotin--[acetyl-CoA-carboxylase] ligase [Paenactinomyces guangxiensis]MBH8591456.1 biotin--[acetyl-CoA-carboxylase] ligase [Paenactinomyces guangxiensis]